jgi:DNA-binding MarR family transcriptional regulator
MRIISFAGTSNAAHVSLKKIVYEVGSANIREILLFYTEKSEQTKEKIKNDKILSKLTKTKKINFEETISKDWETIVEIIKGGEKIVFDITGANKIILLKWILALFYFYEQNKKIPHVIIKYLSIKEELIDLPFHIIFFLIKDKRKNPLKRTILKTLKMGSLSLTDLSKKLSIKKPTILTALKPLVEYGVVEEKKNGRENIYVLSKGCKIFMNLI